MTYIAQLSDGSNTQFFPRTRWDALLNVPSLATTGAFKVTRWDKCLTPQNGCQFGKTYYVERADFINFSIIVVYLSWLKITNKINIWTNVVGATFPKSLLNGYTKLTPLGVCRRTEPHVDIFLNADSGVQLYTRDNLSADAGLPVELAYLIHN